MAGNMSTRQGPRLAVAMAIALLVLVTIVFAAAFAAASLPATAPTPANNAQTAATDVAAALEGASATEGERLIESFQCSICHLRGEGRVAPSFSGIAERAATRRPPMSAAQYLHESIVSPGAYLVAGYANAMPANFSRRLTQAQIGHIISFLLSTPAGESQ